MGIVQLPLICSYWWLLATGRDKSMFSVDVGFTGTVYGDLACA